MKHLKTFETLNQNEPQIGDYVICQELNAIEEINLFLGNNIGKIVFVGERKMFFCVQYTNIPRNISDRFGYGSITNARNMRRDEIKYWSDNKENLETLLSTNKYNL